MKMRYNKIYKFDEVKEILDLYLLSHAHIEEIAEKVGRSLNAIVMLLFAYRKARAGEKTFYNLQSSMYRHVLRYVAEHRTAHVLPTEAPPEEGNTMAKDNAPTTENLIAAVNTAFDNLKETVVNLVEYEVERRASQKSQALLKELE